MERRQAKIDVHKLRSENGQALVEFALILPILLLLVLGIFDFGSAMNSKNDLNFLANTAARYAEVNSCSACTAAGYTGTSAIRDYVGSTAVGQLGGSVTITFCRPSGSTGAVGDALQVSASAPFNWLGVNFPGLPTGVSTLTSTVTVRILQSPGTLYTASAC